jgi:hypothetical protein
MDYDKLESILVDEIESLYGGTMTKPSGAKDDESHETLVRVWNEALDEAKVKINRVIHYLKCEGGE